MGLCYVILKSPSALEPAKYLILYSFISIFCHFLPLCPYFPIQAICPSAYGYRWLLHLSCVRRDMNTLSVCPPWCGVHFLFACTLYSQNVL